MHKKLKILISCSLLLSSLVSCLPRTSFGGIHTPDPTTTVQRVIRSTITKKPTNTTTPVPNIVSLQTQSVVDMWVIATLGESIPPPWYSKRVLFSPDSRMLVSAYSNLVTVWEVGSYRKLYDFPFLNDNYGVENFAFSSDSQYLAATVSYWDDPLSVLFVWNLVTGQQIVDLSLNPAIMEEDSEQPYHLFVDAIGFVPETSILVYAYGNAVQLMDVEEPQQKTTLELGVDMFASEISFPKDGRFIYVLMSWWKTHTFPALWTTKYAVQIWDTNTHKLRRTIDFPEMDWAEEFMGLHNSFLIKRSPVEGTLEMISLENDQVTQLPYRAGESSLNGWTIITQDNRFIMYSRYWFVDEEDEGIEFWTTDSWRHLYTLKPECYKRYDLGGSDPGEIAISPDNTLYAIAYAGQVFVYDIRLITMQ